MVLTVTLVSVAAVPTVLVLTTEHQTTVILQQQDKQQQVVLVSAVKKAGDDLIVKLTSAETSCNTQVGQMVAARNVAPGLIQTQLNQAKSQVHASVAPLLTTIQQRKADFAKLAVVTPRDEEDELGQFQQIEILAFGTTKTTGVVTVNCQSVVLTIQQVIVIVTQAKAPEGRECHIEIEREGNQYHYKRDC
jgi:ribosomal protein L18